MSRVNKSRRKFLESTFYSSLLYASSSLPSLVTTAQASPAPVSQRTLVDLFLAGGPDFRHLIVPAFSTEVGSFGQKYWENRQQSHNLSSYGQTAQERWNDDYYHITVGDTDRNWPANLVDPGSLNTGIEFGILNDAGWLIDMFREGNVALVFNAYGGTNRAHDLSSLIHKQGNVSASLDDQNRSGWGGRLARSANSNVVSLTTTPSAFTFGPLGAPSNYVADDVDNMDLISIGNSRESGLFDVDFSDRQHRIFNERMARASKSYYAGLRQESLPRVYDKALQHEENVRKFGLLITDRLTDIPIPIEIEALYSSDDFYSDGSPNLNPDPDDGSGREVLNSNHVFAPQIRNLFDILAVNDLEDVVNNLPDPSLFPNFKFKPRVMSMEYGGWDSHSEQRLSDSDGVIVSDPTNPNFDRGIESGFRDIFGGQFGDNPSNSNSLHYGFSSLWTNLSTADRQNIVITIAGEFGRQIRDNADQGTDHGEGNLMFVICEECTGGVYGEIFPESEIIKYDEPVENTPGIDPRTEIDQLFSTVCDWVEPGSGSQVFPRMTESPAPAIEINGLFSNLFS